MAVYGGAAVHWRPCSWEWGAEGSSRGLCGPGGGTSVGQVSVEPPERPKVLRRGLIGRCFGDVAVCGCWLNPPPPPHRPCGRCRPPPAGHRLVLGHTASWARGRPLAHATPPGEPPVCAGARGARPSRGSGRCGGRLAGQPSLGCRFLHGSPEPGPSCVPPRLGGPRGVPPAITRDRREVAGGPFLRPVPAPLLCWRRRVPGSEPLREQVERPRLAFCGVGSRDLLGVYYG